MRLACGLELTAAGQGMVEHAKTIREGVNRMARDASDYAVELRDDRAHRTLFVGVKSLAQLAPEAQKLFEYLSGEATP